MGCIVKGKISVSNILIILVLFFCSCSSIQPVVISGIGSIKTQNILTNPEITFDLGVKNPNRYGVTVKRMSLNISLGDSIVAGINIPKKTKIAGHSSVDIPIVMKPSMSSFTNMAVSGFKNIFSRKGNTNLELRGEIIISKFIFTKKIKFKEKINL